MADKIDVQDLREFEGSWFGWWAKEHHDPEAFIEAVEIENAGGSEQWKKRWEVRRKFLNPEKVWHGHWRCVPHHSGAGVTYHQADGPGPGAFPVTVLEAQ